VEELTKKIAHRLMATVKATWEAEGNSYLDTDLASLCEAFFFSRTPPLGEGRSATLPGLDDAGETAHSSKPQCASVGGFSLHAAQAVAAEDREALERLCRYGLRAPFAQERLSLREDGKVVYRLRRPWPRQGGATHLVLEPHDFLRRLASLVSFPYSHQVRHHGVFANRHRHRSRLPRPPVRMEEEESPGSPGRAAVNTTPPVAEADNRSSKAASQRRRYGWAQLLRRVLHVDALCCPRCSTREKSVPMVVLAFLTDPEVVGKILRHLGLPTSAPACSPARSSGRAIGFELAEEGGVSERAEDHSGHWIDRDAPVRPPP